MHLLPLVPSAPPEFTCSQHARQRLEERAITLAQVGQVLAQPFLTRASSDDPNVWVFTAPVVRVARLCWLVVVAAPAGRVPYVITAFWRSASEPAKEVA